MCVLLIRSLQQDYQTYVSRKAKKREDLVTSLTEYHQQELQKIQAERETLVRNFEEKKTSMSHTVIYCTHFISDVTVNSMGEFMCSEGVLAIHSLLCRSGHDSAGERAGAVASAG